MRYSGLVAIDRLRRARPPRVLLVEDDDDLRSLLATVLRTDGHQVVEGRDGVDACRMVAHHLARGDNTTPYDLVVCDLLMPGGSGLDVIQCMGAAGWHMPVIVVTAASDALLRESARRMGAALLFRKPFEIDDLRMAVIHLLRPPRVADWSDVEFAALA